MAILIRLSIIIRPLGVKRLIGLRVRVRFIIIIIIIDVPKWAGAKIDSKEAAMQQVTQYAACNHANV